MTLLSGKLAKMTVKGSFYASRVAECKKYDK